ncbi:MAG TPA: hypothetical protein VGX27_11050 [Candidatus Dormibacteraeota bacterium]|nr:hypothetical protein [Candidatus Dormibacteraeota bacterium]
MELLIVGTWLGGLAGGAAIVIGVFQAVTGRSIFPFAWRGPGPSGRQVTSIGLGWVVLGIAFAMWSLAGGIILGDHLIPPFWLSSAAGLLFALGIATNFAIAAMLGPGRPAK